MDITYNQCLPAPPSSGPHCLSSSSSRETISQLVPEHQYIHSCHGHLDVLLFCCLLTTVLVDNAKIHKDVTFESSVSSLWEMLSWAPPILYICFLTSVPARLTIKVLIPPLELGRHDYKIVWSSLEKLSELNRGASAPSVTKGGF